LPLPRSTETDRGQARHAAGQAEQATRLAQQEATGAQTAEQAGLAEISRVRTDANKMLAAFRADAARDRYELRVDLRARAELVERSADAYRNELIQVRTAGGPVTDTTASGTLPRARPARRS